MNLREEIYNFFNEGRPRTVNAGVDDIERTGTGRKSVDTGIYGARKERIAKQNYEVTITVDNVKKRDIQLTSFEILKNIRLNPDNKDIKFEDIKVGQKYEYTRKTALGTEKKEEIVLKNKTPKPVFVNTEKDKIKFKKKDDKKEVTPYKFTPRDKNVFKFNPGKVHKIQFNTIGPADKKRRVYTIYRTLSDQEYKQLKSGNNQVSVTTEQSSEAEHNKDLYYITIPKNLYGLRIGADYKYVIYLKLDKVSKLTSDQKDKIKLTIVPIKDISEGLKERPLDITVYNGFIAGKNTKRLAGTKKKTKDGEELEDPIDVNLDFISGEMPVSTADSERSFSKAAKEEASIFMLDVIDRLFEKIKSKYSISKTTSKLNKGRDQASDDLEESIKLLVEKVKSIGKKEVEDAVIYYFINDKLIVNDNKKGLYNRIVAEYEKGLKADTTSKIVDKPITKEKPKAEKKKSKPKEKPAAGEEPSTPSGEEEPEEESKDEKIASNFMNVDKKSTLAINSLINTYFKPIEAEDREEKNYQEREKEKEIQKLTIDIVNKVLRTTKKESLRDDIIERIGLRYDALLGVGKDSEALFNRINNIYKKMKTLKESRILKEEKLKKYLIKIKPGYPIEKIFNKGDSGAVENTDKDGRPIKGEFLRAMSDDTASNFKKNISKEENEKYKVSLSISKATGNFVSIDKAPVNLEAKPSIEQMMTSKQIVSNIRKNPENKDLEFYDVEENKPYFYTKDNRDFILTLLDKKERGVISVELYEKPVDKKKDAEEERYKASISVDGEKDLEGVMFGKDIMSKIRKNPENKDLEFYDVEENKPYKYTKDNRNFTIKLISKKPYGGKTVKPIDKLPYPYYVVNIKTRELDQGFDSFVDAKNDAKKKGDYYKAYQKEYISGLKLKEGLAKKDKKSLAVGSAISFTIQDMVTKSVKESPAKRYNITDNITKASISNNKESLIIKTTTGKLEFNKEGNATFTPSEDIVDKQETIGNDGQAQTVLNPPAKLVSLAKKVLGKSKEEPAAEEPAK
jgi:hypothetical protein